MNPVVHLELHTRDLQRARQLYAQLCGWRPELIDNPHGSYLSMDWGCTTGAGIVECASDRPVWLPYVAVPRVDVATDRARELGATVLLAPREGPAGWRSVVAHPDGGELAFWQAKR